MFKDNMHVRWTKTNKPLGRGRKAALSHTHTLLRGDKVFAVSSPIHRKYPSKPKKKKKRGGKRLLMRLKDCTDSTDFQVMQAGLEHARTNRAKGMNKQTQW